MRPPSGVGGVYSATLSATGAANVATLGATGIYTSTMTATGAANAALLGCRGGVYTTTLAGTGAANLASLSVGPVYSNGTVTAVALAPASGNLNIVNVANSVVISGTAGTGAAVNLDLSTFLPSNTNPTSLRMQAVDVGGYQSSLGLLQSNGSQLLTRLFLNNTGQFGFGTVTPGHVVDVVGNVRASANLIANGAFIGNVATVGALAVNGGASVAGNLTAGGFSAGPLTANTISVSNSVTTSVLTSNNLAVYGPTVHVGNVNVTGDTSTTGNITGGFIRSQGAVTGNTFNLTIPLLGDQTQILCKYFLPASQTFSVAVAPAADANAASYNFSMYSVSGNSGGSYAVTPLTVFNNGVVVAANCPGSSAQHWLSLASVSGFGAATTQVDVVAGGATANGTYRNSGTVQYSKQAGNLQILFQTAAATGANVRYGAQPLNYL